SGVPELALPGLGEGPVLTSAVGASPPLQAVDDCRSRTRRATPASANPVMKDGSSPAPCVACREADRSASRIVGATTALGTETTELTGSDGKRRVPGANQTFIRSWLGPELGRSGRPTKWPSSCMTTVRRSRWPFAGLEDDALRPSSFPRCP